MFDSLLNGMILGFGVSVPFGPVNILILTYALRVFKNSLAVGLGAFSVDMLYFFLLKFGLIGFLDNAIFMKILAVFGFVFLSYMAFLMLVKKNKDLNLKNVEFKENLFKSCLKGVFLNGLNPFVIGFWLSVAGIAIKESHPNAMLIGLIVAILSWIFALSFFVARYKDFFSARIIKFINIISALIIEYFAINLLYKTFLG
ncbi:TPA: LysE family transporter [Campylobacter jejuni]|nr:LysE family transporter [Campylobacter jejuni]